MPRPGPRRPLVAIRLSEQDIAAIDQRATEAGVTRSEMMRRMLAYAAAHMPAKRKP
jgi:predicted DNA binding CopG/RHH family protein